MEKRISATAAQPMELYDFLRLVLGLTKRQIRQAKFREAGIRVNGEQRRVTSVLSPGDVVEVCLEAGQRSSDHLVLSEKPVEILYEDGDLCIVNKPAGVATHPGGGCYGDTVANRLMYYFHNKGEALRIRPVGRLDRETSGVLLFAKNQAAAGRLVRQRERKILRKEYLALAEGQFGEDEIRSLSSGLSEGRASDTEWTISVPLGRDPENPCRAICTPEGKEAVTHGRILREYAGYTALAVRLDTGRMHQIRAHMAYLGHPLLGDELYGGSRERIGRAALHARRLTLRQPFTGELLTVEAPLPEDMEKLL
ncbi:MAG: RluA family pseudouridine synthase [Lachnospiraceae bacterium]|nr:RluA family pseudouridine synthase [Lachnospiraceae bacterium]